MARIDGSEPVCYIEKEALINGWSEFIDRYDWQGFWTLTFEHDFSFWSAQKAFKRWASQFTVSEPSSLSFIGFAEWGKRDPRVPHIHCLTRLERLPRVVMWKEWFKRYGRARSEAYDTARGGKWYLAKYVTKELTEVIIDERKTLQSSMSL